MRMTRATAEEHHPFFWGCSNFWELKTCLSPKADLEKSKTATIYRMKNPMASCTQRESAKKNGLLFIFSTRLWVKKPCRSEDIFAKKRYTSIVACVVYTWWAVAALEQTGFVGWVGYRIRRLQRHRIDRFRIVLSVGRYKSRELSSPTTHRPPEADGVHTQNKTVRRVAASCT